MAQTVGVQVNRINPGKLDIKAVERDLRRLAEQEAKEMEEDFNKTHKTWRTDVQFERKVSVFGVDLRIEVYTTNDIWRFLNDGTSVRYATMGAYSPKTKIRTVASYRGSGDALFVSRQRPQRGIDAREWTTVVPERRAPKFRTKLRKQLGVSIRWKGGGTIR